MKRLILIATATTFLTACGDNGVEQNTPAADNEVTTTTVPAEQTKDAVLGPAIAADQAKALMHERHEGMEDIGDAFKALNATLKQSEPDSSVLATSGTTIARLAHESSKWFPPGTGPDVGKTRAKAEIWQKPEDFAAKANDFRQAADRFNDAQKTGSLAAIRDGAAALGKTCKACHDLYRGPEEH